MKKAILLLGCVLFSTGFLPAKQDIFKKYGHKKELLTLSKGKYQEVFRNDEVVQIGTVLLNTKTNKVVKLLQEDTTKTNYNAELSSRFLTVDPLAENHPEISPYVFCNNNPIINIDPDGKDWYQAENGNAIWRRSTDATYTDANGVKYKNIGEQYITANGTVITLFQQKTNDKGEMYLTSVSYDAKTEKMTDKALGVLMIQNSDASRVAVMKSWANPTFGNYIKAILTEVASQYTNPYLVVGGLSVGVAGLSSLPSSLNNVDELIAAGTKMPKVKAGQQISVSGNIDDIFNSLSKGGQKINPNQVRLPDGTLITKYSATSGSPTLQINKGGQIIKVRVR